MDIVSVGPVAGGPAALEREMKQVATRLSGDRMALLFLPVGVDHLAYVRAAEEGLGGPVVGATTGGAAFTERGVTEDLPVAAVLGGPDLAFSIGVVPQLEANPDEGIARAVRPIVEAARAHVMRSHALLTLADAYACDGEALLSAITDAVPPHWRLFGGTAGDGWKFTGTRIIVHGEVYEHGAVMVGLFSEAVPSLATRHGWCPAPGGHAMIVTGIEGNRLLTINGEPAAHAYASELRRLGVLDNVEDPFPVMAKYELGAKTVFGNELKIRAPLSIGEDGSVQLASALPPGTIVRVVTASPDQLIGAATELSSRVLEPLNKSAIRGSLVFDCSARWQLLGDRYQEQVAAFMGGRSFPMVGMACYGEIARFGGSIEGFHNTTAVMAAW